MTARPPQHVPLVDLARAHRRIAAALRQGWDAVLDRSAFVLGDEVREFEDRFARFCGVAHCVGVGSGTDALELAMRAIGLGPGDEVIVPANSFVASAMAVVRTGATPALVDVDPETLLIDVSAVESCTGPRSRAVMPVHLFGQICAMGRLTSVAESEGIAVVEDAAQAHGARQDGVAAGGFGLAAGTSFYPGKNLGACGDGGAVLTQSAEVAGRVRALRNYGSEMKYHHPEIGFNSRLDTLQAVVLLAKLDLLADANDARRAAAARYDGLLQDLEEVQRLRRAPGNEHVFHLYVVRVPDRDRIVKELNAAGVGAGVHYPVPIHLQPAFADLGYGHGDFPVAERAAAEILSLPMFPEITPDEQEYVVDMLRKSLR